MCAECSLYRESADDDLDPVCPACGTAQKGARRSYWTPLFGFVALARREAAGHGRAAAELARRDVRAVARGGGVRRTSGRCANGGTAATWAGERGELIAISEGRNGAGFLICEWCGWGTPRAARADRRRSRIRTCSGTGECTGPLQLRSLAHPYETDLLEITFDGIPGRPAMSVGEWRSILYALLEGASDSLDISRDDIDGTLYPRAGGEISLVLFDTVPGGAGGACGSRSFPQVLETALRRMARCECGEETSCYGCLRNFRNQAFHDELRRGDAMGFLAPLIGV